MLPPEAFACLPLERAVLPPVVWHIAVAALIGNAFAPVYDHGRCSVVSSGRWSGPMGRAPKRPPVTVDDMRAAVESHAAAVALLPERENAMLARFAPP